MTIITIRRSHIPVLRDKISFIFELAIHCAWGPWKEGQCSVTCGAGIKVDTREKTIVEKYGGVCDGCEVEVTDCTVDTACPGK